MGRPDALPGRARLPLHRPRPPRARAIPTLVLHGDDDQIVPIGASAHLSAKLLTSAQLKVYPGFPHGMCTVNKDQINEDLLAFLSS